MRSAWWQPVDSLGMNRHESRVMFAADALAVSTRTGRRYIAKGQLEAVRLGRKTLRFKVDSIERFIDANRSATGVHGHSMRAALL